MKRIDFKKYDEDFEDEIFPLSEKERLHILDKYEIEKYSALIIALLADNQIVIMMSFRTVVRNPLM
jgi:hypothetical protein